MRHVAILLLVGALSFATPAAAQEVDDDEPPHSLQEDAWALQFGIGQNFTLNAFEGTAISLKRHTSAEHAWQIGLGLDGGIGRQKVEPDSGDTGEQDRNNVDVKLTARYLVYPMLTEGAQFDKLQLFAGAGPLISYGRQEYGEPGDYKRTYTNFTAGLSAVLGAEWFVTKRISLNAYYESALTYLRRTTAESQEESQEDGFEEEEVLSRFSLGGRGVTFGLSVYF